MWHQANVQLAAGTDIFSQLAMHNQEAAGSAEPSPVTFLFSLHLTHLHLGVGCPSKTLPITVTTERWHARAQGFLLSACLRFIPSFVHADQEKLPSLSQLTL